MSHNSPTDVFTSVQQHPEFHSVPSFISAYQAARDHHITDIALPLALGCYAAAFDHIPFDSSNPVASLDRVLPAGIAILRLARGIHEADETRCTLSSRPAGINGEAYLLRSMPGQLAESFSFSATPSEQVPPYRPTAHAIENAVNLGHHLLFKESPSDEASCLLGFVSQRASMSRGGRMAAPAYPT